MSELKLIDCFAQVGKHFEVINSQEFAYICGSLLVIRTFSSVLPKKIKTLKSEESGFNCFAYNKKRNIFAVSEGGKDTVIKLYQYVVKVEEENLTGGLSTLDNKSKSSNFENFVFLTSVIIPDSLSCNCIAFNKECTAMFLLFNEPLFELKVYDISECFKGSIINDGLKTVNTSFDKSVEPVNILNIKLKCSYSRIIVNNISKQDYMSLILFSKNLISSIEISDAFPKNYNASFIPIRIDENNKIYWNDDIELRNREESMLVKKYIINHKKADIAEEEEFIDACWDLYNNIYVASITCEIFLLDIKLRKIEPVFKNEVRPIVQLSKSERPCNLLISQRYLICSLETSEVVLINPYIPPEEINQYKNCLGTKDKYEVFIINKRIMVNNLGLTSNMMFDLRFQNIYATTKEGSLKIVPIVAEVITRDKDKEDGQIFTTNNDKEIESFDEFKSHLYDLENVDGGDNWLNKVIGIKEIPNTTQFISIADDQKMIFWELSDQSAKVVNYLEFCASCFEIDSKGNLLVIGSEEGVIRIYDISQKFFSKLIYQNKFLTRESHKSISKIIIHPNNHYIIFYNTGDNLLFFISGDPSSNFSFLGFVQTPLIILDVSLFIIEKSDEIVVLGKQMLLSFSLENEKLVFDHKNAIKVSNKKNYNIMNNFEVKVTWKARKVDSDLNLIIKNLDSSEFFWLTGEDKYFKQYKLPSELLESLKDNKRSPENPQDEIRAHDLNVCDGESFKEFLLSGSNDGCIHLRANNNLIGTFRSHNYLLDGISTISVSQKNQVIYVGGYDGSIFIFGLNNKVTGFIDVINKNGEVSELEALESLEIINDEELKSIEEIVHLEYIKLIKNTKKQYQAVLKDSLDKLKSELNKLISENNKEEEIEQLKPEEMIIDPNRIEFEKKQGEVQCFKTNRQLFEELASSKIYKIKLFQKTYNTLLINDSNGKVINNNMIIFTDIAGDKFLKSFPIRNFTKTEESWINHAKQLRIIELQEKYKRRANGIPEAIDESRFTNLTEEYLVNRISAQIELKEYEIPLKDILDNYEGGEQSEKSNYKAAKYKLQRDPYENFGIKLGKAEDSGEGIKYKPEEQLLKENLTFKFNTAISKQVDVELKHDYTQIDVFNLLYSPFELYSTLRMRTQVFLIMDIIKQLKTNFNKDFKAFVNEKNNFLNKFNTNKQNMDILKELLNEPMDDEYPIKINEYEDNEWVTKFNESELKIPKYYSKEEKELMENEEKIKQDRLRALEGDTLEMRGLKYMIGDDKKKEKNENAMDEEELIPEPWMQAKDTSKFNEEEMKKFNEFNRKKKELEDRKEKIRSQNYTKLNNIRMDMDNLKADIESKFLKIMKKKLYYEYRITEQEMYILSIMRIQEYRLSIQESCKKMKSKMDLKSVMLKEFTELYENFKKNYEVFNYSVQQFESRFKEIKNNPHAGSEIKEILFQLDLTDKDKEILKEIRYDPYYFDTRTKLIHSKKFGINKFKKIEITDPKNKDIIELENRKYYVSNFDI